MTIQFIAPVPDALTLSDVRQEFSLPLRDEPENIIWESDPPGLEVKVDSANISKVSLTARRDCPPFVFLTYKIISGNVEHTGRVSILIPPEPDKQQHQDSTPTDKEQQQVKPQDPGTDPSQTTKNDVHDNNNIKQSASSPILTKGISLSPKPIPENCSRLRLIVLQDDGQSSGLEFTLIKGRTYIIGKDTANLSNKPDIDISTVFKNDEQRRKCESRILSLRWEKDTVSVQLVAKRKIYNLSGNNVKKATPLSFYWLSGTILLLPCGLQIYYETVVG